MKSLVLIVLIACIAAAFGSAIPGKKNTKSDEKLVKKYWKMLI